MKPINVTDYSFAEYNEEFNKKYPKCRVGDHVRISKYKNIFAKGYVPNWSEVFIVKKIKNTVPWIYTISDLNGEQIIGSFYEKELQKTNQKEFKIEKVLKRKGDQLYVKWKGYDNSFNSWINKKDIKIKISEYFPKPPSDYKNIKVKVDLTNYVTKKDINDIAHVYTSNFALKTNLANLKTKVDKLDIGKLVPVPLDLSKLSNVVKNDVFKKLYDKLVAKVNNFDTCDFVLKTKYSTNKTKLENKIRDISNLVKKTDCNTKITELENKIPDINNLATKTALITVENKIPSISNLATKSALTTV